MGRVDLLWSAADIHCRLSGQRAPTAERGLDDDGFFFRVLDGWPAHQLPKIDRYGNLLAGGFIRNFPTNLAPAILLPPKQCMAGCRSFS